jgi:hypothetical protein
MKLKFIRHASFCIETEGKVIYINPFLDYEDKCSFILCRTSNPSAGDFQDLTISSTPVYQIVAQKIREWNTNKNCGAVVGATYPEELKTVRSILGEDIPILIPGVGKQGGDVEKTPGASGRQGWRPIPDPRGYPEARALRPAQSDGGLADERLVRCHLLPQCHDLFERRPSNGWVRDSGNS